MAEAPEGVVGYSWSGAKPVAGATGIQVGPNAYIDTTDYLGTKYLVTQYLTLSETFIETLDLVSEGIINGPRSGQWIFSGNLGQTGWSNAYFSGYSTPAGYPNAGWMRSVYWNQLPVLSANSQFNFQNVNLSYTQGLPNGDAIQQLTNQETTSRSIGTRIYAGDENSQFFTILNRNCNAVIVNIKAPTLSSTDTAGNIKRVFIQYKISYQPLFSTINKIADLSPPVNDFIFGKITTAGGFIKSTQINFNLSSFNSNGVPQQSSDGFFNDIDFIGWNIKVTRVTPDSTSALVTDAIYIDSISELYTNKLSYPNSAIIRSEFDARFFSEIPQRAFECDFLNVNIPANYNPISRTYATNGYGTTNGYWNGTFASGKAWTNNPAWCFYDLLTNQRYGLGKYIENLSVDQFDLYNIAQYCDELVADGYGNIEPRFTCNAWIAQKEEAYKIINDMASIFRGMVYYFNGSLNTSQDSPKQRRVIFTNSNVKDGDFVYNTTSKNTRQSVAVIRYNDPKNFYQPAVEYVENLDAIRRYGIRELPIVAFGCTSRGQAIRLGRWALYTNNNETETVSFTAGLEANLLRCGDVFGVVDFNRKTQRYAGRVLQINNTGYINIGVTGASLILDSNAQLNTGVQYSMSLLTPSYYYSPSQMTGLTSNDYSNIHKSFLQNIYFSGDICYNSGNNTIVNLTGSFDASNFNLTGNPVWTIELGPNSLNYTGNYYFSNLDEDQYRVINIKEVDDTQYQISAVSYYPEKFSLIDTGLVLQSYQQSSAAQIPATPRNLSMVYGKLTNTQGAIQYSFLIDNYANTTNYIVFSTTGAGGFVGNSIPNQSYVSAVIPASVTNAAFIPTVTGLTTFRIYGYNSNGYVYSTGYASNSVLVTAGIPVNGVTINALQLN